MGIILVPVQMHGHLHGHNSRSHIHAHPLLAILRHFETLINEHCQHPVSLESITEIVIV